VSEFKNNGVLFKVRWKRIVLDEGHVIRNHKSKQSEAIFTLESKYRWVLTGTPIQNKEMDVFATFKFLKVEPFDDLHLWNQYIGGKKNSSDMQKQRLPFILKAILLRRTKEELMKTGEIVTLPTKTVENFEVTLNKEEKFIYTRVMMYSKSVFADYLQQQMDKANNYNYDKNRLGQVYSRMAQKYQVNHEIKTHEILVLLLRMRQACCHPGLLKSMLEAGDLNNGEDERVNHEDGEESIGDLMKDIEKLNLNEESEDGGNRWSLNNPVFSLDRPSSKIEHMMDVLREKVLPTEDKAIIVSQWTSYLNVVRGMLEIENVSYCELNGTVQVKDRNDIVQKFNDPRSGIRVMLLSLTAGGVGLNLVGANYLLLMDLHWNPQLEQQAMDRIYRFGQKKDVKIFK
jgi:transcription termination factor 2